MKRNCISKMYLIYRNSNFFLNGKWAEKGWLNQVGFARPPFLPPPPPCLFIFLLISLSIPIQFGLSENKFFRKKSTQKYESPIPAPLVCSR